MASVPAVPNWFFFPSDPPAETADPNERLKRVEDRVRSDFEARDELYLLVAYKFLHARGMRIAAVDAEIRREVRK